MKSIQRTNRLNNGRDVGNGVSVKYEEVPGGMRKVRCPHCQAQYATEAKTPGGKTVYRCQCGAEFTSVRL